ncbi:MAG: hypothetical protein WBP82_03755 [Leuconostoc mesenteroides]
MKKIKHIFNINNEDIYWTVGQGVKGREIDKITFGKSGSRATGVGELFGFQLYVVHSEDGTETVLPADKFGTVWVDTDETD